MSDYLVVTSKGKRLIATKWGIPYGLIIFIYSRYGLLITLPAMFFVQIGRPFWTGFMFSMWIWYLWWLAFMYAHPTNKRRTK